MILDFEARKLIINGEAPEGLHVETLVVGVPAEYLTGGNLAGVGRIRPAENTRAYWEELLDIDLGDDCYEEIFTRLEGEIPRFLKAPGLAAWQRAVLLKFRG